MDKTALIIFAREPQVGKVKTRLAEQLSPPTAMQVYIAMLKDVLNEAAKVLCGHRFLFYWVEEGNATFLKGYGDQFELRPQEGSTLGECMHNAFTYCHENGYGRTVIIGTDCVTLKAKDVEEAFRKLDAHDCVLGPAKDGGYYLIGLREPEAKIFEGIEWGTSKVLEQTIRRNGELKKTTFLLREEIDIDTVEDLMMVARRVERTNVARNTQKVITLLRERNRPKDA